MQDALEKKKIYNSLDFLFLFYQEKKNKPQFAHEKSIVLKEAVDFLVVPNCGVP